MLLNSLEKTREFVNCLHTAALHMLNSAEFTFMVPSAINCTEIKNKLGHCRKLSCPHHFRLSYLWQENSGTIYCSSIQTPQPQLLCKSQKNTCTYFLGGFCFLFGCGGAGKPAWFSLYLLESRKVTCFFHLLTEMQQLPPFIKLPLTLMMF